MQARCVQLARMGCVVFHYDMIGYGDSQQIPESVAHLFPRSRIEIKEAPRTGFYSAGAELRLQGMLGLHTFNSIRALGFLCSLPDVDPKRIAVTGGSGGGTQTFMLCAIDDRPRVSVPAVIVGTTRQGGCTCEHACGFRLRTYNLEFTALHAPKPLLLISADDSTRDMPERGFPEIRRLYQLLGAERNVVHKAHLHFPHNYNAVSRADMYHFVNRHLELGLEEPIEEKPYRRLTTEEMTVWDEEHPRPDGGKEFEERLLAWLAADSDRQLAALRPHDADSLQRFREIVGAGWKELLRGELPAAVRVESRRREGTLELGLLRYETVERHQAELPIAIVRPAQSGSKVVIWIDGAGKRALFDPDGKPNRSVQRLTASGHTVIGVDLLHQGEFLADGEPVRRNRSLPNEEAFAGWTYCYNMPVFARRVHDVLASISFASGLSSADAPNNVALLGLNDAGPIAAAALAIAGPRIHRAAIDTKAFRFETLRDIYDIDFLPGSVKYLDLPGALTLAAPVRLMLAGEDPRSAELVRAAYDASSAGEKLTLYDGKGEDLRASLVSFVIGP